MIDTADAFTTNQAATLTGTTYRQVDYWCRVGLLRPSIRDAAGSGTERLFSSADVVSIRLIRSLLSKGVDHDVIREALALDPAHAAFLWVQGDVVGLGSGFDLLEALDHVQATTVVNLSVLRAGLVPNGG